MTFKEFREDISQSAGKMRIGGYVENQECKADHWLRTRCPHKELITNIGKGVGCGSFFRFYVDDIYVGEIWRDEWSIKEAPLLFSPSETFERYEDLEIHEAVRQVKVNIANQKIDKLAGQIAELREQIKEKQVEMAEMQDKITAILLDGGAA